VKRIAEGPMDTGPLRTVVRHLRRWAGPGEVAPSSDADLLTRFIRTRDEAAFAEIVQRHGPLVWAVCRSRLSAADADDAFQATFVVLARRAGSIRKRPSLASWLSGVARRVVKTVRARQLRRREVPLDLQHAPSGKSAEIERLDWRAVLDEELDRLPEKYRLPTLLCYYQGLTNEEAAKRLRWPHGTVCGRLARARHLLRKRLTRRGVTIAIGAFASGVAGPPTDLIAATLRASAAVNANGTVLQLAEAVMTAMWISKVKAWTAAGLAVVMLGSGTAGWVLIPAAAQVKSPDHSAPKVSDNEARTADANNVQAPRVDAVGAVRLTPDVVNYLKTGLALSEPAPADDPLGSLMKQRHQSAMKELDARFRLFTAGSARGTIDVLLAGIRRAGEAERALSSRQADQIRAYERELVLNRFVEKANELRFNAGQIPTQDLEQSKYYRLDVEIKLLAAKGQTGGDTVPKTGR
jgi:RNA polymerase sigma factor (sigma-70 family)